VTVISGRIVKADRSGRVRVRLSCQNTGVACEGSLGLTFIRRHPSGRSHVASATFFLAPGTSRTLVLRVDRLGHELLAAGHRQRAELTITGTAGVSMGSMRLTVVPPRRRQPHHPVPR
jgi:hypothetical protein